MTSPLDLDAISQKWLQPCGSCDAGLPTSCTHPSEDYRPVMLALVRRLEAALARVALLEDDLWPSGGLSRVRWRHTNLGSGGSVEFDDLERAQTWHETYCVNRSPIDPPAGPCAIQRATSTTWPDGAEWRGPWTDVADSRDGQGESR